MDIGAHGHSHHIKFLIDTETVVLRNHHIMYSSWRQIQRWFVQICASQWQTMAEIQVAQLQTGGVWRDKGMRVVLEGLELFMY